MTLSLRLLPICLAGALVFASCGGGDNAREVLSGGDAAPTTEAPIEIDVVDPEPAADRPGTTAAPATTASPDTVTTVTEPPDGEADDGGDADAYCGASAQFYIEARALSEIGDDDNEAARRLFAQMQVSLSASLLNAPDEGAAEAPRFVEQLFSTLLPALDTLGYDFADLETLPDSDDVAGAFTDFVQAVDRLEVFLVDECGADLASLRLRATELATEIGSVPVPDGGGDTAEGNDTGDAQTVSDDSGSIIVRVPATWTDVRGAPDGAVRQLVAAADAEAFLAAYSEPGVIVASGDATAGNGAEAARGALDAIETSIESDGCSQNTASPYDDGVYVGEQLLYSCPGTSSSTRLAAGTNSDGDLFWLLAVVTVEGDDETWPMITDSFLVD